MSADIGFSLGFFCGAVLAGVGVYLAAAPEGKKIRLQLEKEFHQHREEFTIKALTSEAEKVSELVPLTNSLHDFIHKIQTIINPTPPVIQKNSSNSHVTKHKRYFKSTV